MKMKLLGVVLALSCWAPSGLNADLMSTLDEAFLICSSAAKAAWEYTKKPDWEYTKWGMTPQQVVSASKNLATEASDLRPDSDGNVTKLVAPYLCGDRLAMQPYPSPAAMISRGCPRSRTSQ